MRISGFPCAICRSLLRRCGGLRLHQLDYYLSVDGCLPGGIGNGLRDERRSACCYAGSGCICCLWHKRPGLRIRPRLTFSFSLRLHLSRSFNLSRSRSLAANPSLSWKGIFCGHCQPRVALVRRWLLRPGSLLQWRVWPWCAESLADGRRAHLPASRHPQQSRVSLADGRRSQFEF